MPRSIPVTGSQGCRRLFKVTVRTRFPALLSLLALSESSLRRDTCDNHRPRSPAVSPREGSVPGVTLPWKGWGERLKDISWGQSHAPSPTLPDPAVSTTQDQDPQG